MKRFNYFMIAAAIVSLMSCEKEATKEEQPVLEPKADFSFVIEEGTGKVTFENKSVNADAYEWEFGDEANTLSEEENPVFTYQKNGDYDVTLTAIKGDMINSLSKSVKIVLKDNRPTLSITIDNKYDDWENIPWREDVKTTGDVQRIKVAATKDDIYVMIQAAKGMKSHGFIPRVLVDVDNNKNTGSDQCLWITEDGADVMQQEAAYLIWGWRAEEGIVGPDWIKDNWIEWESGVVGEYTLMEWKLDMNYAFATMQENSIFQIPNQDYTKFATTKSDDFYRMAIGFFDGQWQYYTSAPEKGGVPFVVKVAEYVEVK